MGVVDRQLAILILVCALKISDWNAATYVTAPLEQHREQPSDPVAGDAMRRHLREDADVVFGAHDAFAVAVMELGVDNG